MVQELILAAPGIEGWCSPSAVNGEENARKMEVKLLPETSAAVRTGRNLAKSVGKPGSALGLF
jgi:hypothetical protein